MQRFSNMRCIVSSNVVYAKNWADPFGSAQFLLLKVGLERPLRKHASGMFSGRGRVPQIQDASDTDVD